jgi:hypothetical protein
MKEQKIDPELRRLQGLMNIVDELADRLGKFERDFGKAASRRCRAYLRSRKDWVFDWINEDL